MSYERMELTADEIRGGMYTGDKEKDLQMVNALLAGNVAVKTASEEPVPPQEPVQDESPTDDSEPVGEADGDDVTELDNTQLINPLEEDLDREQKYAQFLEQQSREERDKYLLESQKVKEDLDKERKAREELEKRLRELNELQAQRPSTSNSPTDDELEEEDEYVSEYAKRTRRMIEEMASRLGDSPEVKQLKDEVALIKNEYETERHKREQLRKQQAEEEARTRVYNSIRDFQREVPELKMSKDITEVENEFLRFRKDLAYLTKAKNQSELEKIIEDYMSGGEYKKIADERGIKPPEDYQKYQMLIELNDMKRGVQYDPVLGKEIPILNDEGEQVKYRSYKEAYLVKNMDKRLQDERKKAYKETAKKLTQLQSGAVELPTSNTDSFSTGMTAEQERDLLRMDPRKYINDPRTRELVRSVYQKRGMEVPTYRGQKI